MTKTQSATHGRLKIFQRSIRLLGPEKVIRVLKDCASASRLERIERVVERRIEGVTIVLARLHDPHNGAAALRSAEGLGLQHVHAVEPVEPFRYSSKVTVGCEKWLTVHRYREFEQCRTALKRDGYSLMAAVPGSQGGVEDIPGDCRVALLFGNERDGLDPEEIRRCDGKFSYPMWGFTASYNLSVSVGLTVSEVSRRYRNSLGQSGDLSDHKKTELRALWLCHSVAAAPSLLRKVTDAATSPGG